MRNREPRGRVSVPANRRYARRMSAPLDNPDARRLLQQAGIVCNLGQASEIIDELSPLLAAEGIDLHRPGPLDPVGFRTALADAVERIDLERYTPVEASRAHALRLVGVAVMAMCVADIRTLNEVIASIDPNPQDTRHASTAHVIGVCLGRLDSWHTNPTTRTAVAGTHATTTSTELTSATRDVLALASPEGHAFRSIRLLLVRHGTVTLLIAALFAVAASLAAWAEHDGMDMDDVISGMLEGRI
jgi:hypothetical protein